MHAGKRWPLFLAGAVLLLLSLWGWWGGGTASRLFPEKAAPEAAPPVAALPAEAGDGAIEVEGGEARLLFDASTHLRDHPLRDPFQPEGAGPAPAPVESRKASAPAAAAKPAGGGGAAPARQAAAEPQLRGLMAYGEKRRALIEWGGQVTTAAEGSVLGPWTVTAIGDSSVTLANGGATRTLTAH